MEIPCYRIKDWGEHFENNRTREIKHLNWVPLPTKLDGDGYTELIDRTNGAAVYGAWIVCVIIASKCRPRGTLVRSRGTVVRDNGTSLRDDRTSLRDDRTQLHSAFVPHDSTSLARISRIPAEVFDEMFAVTQSIGWIEVIDAALDCGITALGCALPNPNPITKSPPGSPRKKTPSYDATKAELPFGSEKFVELWTAWCKHRKEIRKPLTETSVSRALKKLERMGEETAIGVLDHSIANGWQGLHPPKSDDEIRADRVPTKEELEAWTAH